MQGSLWTVCEATQAFSYALYFLLQLRHTSEHPVQMCDRVDPMMFAIALLYFIAKELGTL